MSGKLLKGKEKQQAQSNETIRIGNIYLKTFEEEIFRTGSINLDKIQKAIVDNLWAARNPNDKAIYLKALVKYFEGIKEKSFSKGFPFYVLITGGRPGIYSDFRKIQDQIKGIKEAQYRGAYSLAEAFQKAETAKLANPIFVDKDVYYSQEKIEGIKAQQDNQTCSDCKTTISYFRTLNLKNQDLKSTVAEQETIISNLMNKRIELEKINCQYFQKIAVSKFSTGVQTISEKPVEKLSKAELKYQSLRIWKDQNVFLRKLPKEVASLIKSKVKDHLFEMIKEAQFLFSKMIIRLMETPLGITFHYYGNENEFQICKARIHMGYFRPFIGKFCFSAQQLLDLGLISTIILDKPTENLGEKLFSLSKRIFQKEDVNAIWIDVHSIPGRYFEEINRWEPAKHQLFCQPKVWTAEPLRNTDFRCPKIPNFTEYLRWRVYETYSYNPKSNHVDFHLWSKTETMEIYVPINIPSEGLSIKMGIEEEKILARFEETFFSLRESSEGESSFMDEEGADTD